MKAVALEWNDNSVGTFSYASSPFIQSEYTIWIDDSDLKFYLIGGAPMTGRHLPPCDTMDEAKAQAEALNQERAEIFLKTYYEESK